MNLGFKIFGSLAVFVVLVLIVIGLGVAANVGWMYDYAKFPSAHIRNERFVVGLYAQTFGFGTTPNQIITVTDLRSPAKRERKLLTIEGDGPVVKLVFIDPCVVRVEIARNPSWAGHVDLDLLSDLHRVVYSDSLVVTQLRLQK